MADTEHIDVVDEDNKVIGETDVATAHAQRLLHRIIGVFVFDADGELYVQTGNKYEKYDLTVGGHVEKGESYENAARREMVEEIGLDAPVEHISTFLPAEARLGHFWAIYVAVAPPGWRFEPTEEVRSLKKVSMKDLLESMRSQPEKFTHGFMNAMKEYHRVRSIS